MYDNGGRRGEVLFMDEHFHILLLVVEGGGRVCGGGGTVQGVREDIPGYLPVTLWASYDR